MSRIRVLVVDDFRIVVRGLRHLLESTGDFEVVGEYAGGDGLLEEAARIRPDIITLDLRLPGALAPDLCRDLCRTVPESRIVILTAYDDRVLLQACLRAGANGILLKDIDEFDIVRALREVAAGRMVIDARVSPILGVGRRGAAVHDGSGGVYDPLTPREEEVLRLFACGMTSREIGEDLELTVNTVRSYSQSLLSKLQAHNRVQALETARRLHLI